MYYKNQLLYFVIIGLFSSNVFATDFNFDMLSSDDKKNIDEARFSNENYIVPGVYPIQVVINQRAAFSANVEYFELENSNNKEVVACITKEILSEINFKEEYAKDIFELGSGCLSLEKLNGVIITSKISENILLIQVPQSYLENNYEGWTSPSKWDEGIPALLFDYNINNEYRSDDKSKYYVSGYGLIGANIGSWRLRSDVNGFYYGSDKAENRSDFKFNSFYLYRNIKALKSNLTIGEHFSTSEVFDSIKINGISLKTDQRMYPPVLRGFAPNITGSVSSNATISITYNDMTIYQTTVAPGVYNIDDIPAGIRGRVKVTVKEDSGKESFFYQVVESLPFLTRKGFARYNLFAGKPVKKEHETDDFTVFGGDITYGLSNSTSLISGVIVSQSNLYKTINTGFAQRLGAYGTMSFYASFSDAQLRASNTEFKGQSYRLNYMKTFDKLDSAIQFSGYRFSTSGYLSLPQYLSLKTNSDIDFYDEGNNYYSSYAKRPKEQFTVQVTKRMTLSDSKKVNMSFSATSNNYWNAKSDTRINASLGTNFSALGKEVNLFLNGYAYDDDEKNKGISLELSFPLGGRGDLSYRAAKDSGNTSNELTYFNRIENTPDYYRISASHENDGSVFSGYYNNSSSITNTYLSGRMQDNGKQNLSVRFNGGVTLSQYGASFHPIKNMGQARVFVDAAGVRDLPIGGNRLKTNLMGNTVVDVSSYSNEDIKIDFTRMPDSIDSIDTVKSLTLTNGAVGYAKFNAVEGEKKIIHIKMEDSYPPLGSIIMNKNNIQVGMLDNDGVAFVSGLKTNEKFKVNWGDDSYCSFIISDLNQKDFICE